MTKAKLHLLLLRFFRLYFKWRLLIGRWLHETCLASFLVRLLWVVFSSLNKVVCVFMPKCVCASEYKTPQVFPVLFSDEVF